MGRAQCCLPDLASLTLCDSQCETGPPSNPSSIKGITDKLRKKQAAHDREIKKRDNLAKKEFDRVEKATVAKLKREAAVEAKQQATEKKQMDAAAGRSKRVQSESEKVETIESSTVVETIESQTMTLYSALRTKTNQPIQSLDTFKQHYAEGEKELRGQLYYNRKMHAEAKRRVQEVGEKSAQYKRDRMAGVVKSSMSDEEKASLIALSKKSTEAMITLDHAHSKIEGKLETFRLEWLYYRSPQLLEMLYSVNKQPKPVTAFDLYRTDVEARYDEIQGDSRVPGTVDPSVNDKNNWQKRMWALESPSDKEWYTARAKQQNSSANPITRQKMVDEASQLAWESGLAKYGQSNNFKLALYERKSLDVIPMYSSSGSVAISVSNDWLNDVAFNRTLATLFRVDGTTIRKTNRVLGDGGRISITCHGPEGGRVVLMGLALAIVANGLDDFYAAYRITFGDGFGGVMDDDVVLDE